MATAESTTRVCAGCSAVLVAGPRERNARKWCSESCRQRTFRATHEEYRTRHLEQGRARSREKYVPTSHALFCVVCGASFAARWRSTKFCSDPCRYKNYRRARRGRLRAADSSPYTFAEVVALSHGQCRLCDQPVAPQLRYPDPDSGSVDHIVPLALGGADALHNVQLAHLRCNWQKGARL